jgi:hypothetical protein
MTNRRYTAAPRKIAKGAAPAGLRSYSLICQPKSGVLGAGDIGATLRPAQRSSCYGFKIDRVSQQTAQYLKTGWLG